MTDPAIIEAAAKALTHCRSVNPHFAARAVVAAITPLIEAAALEKITKVHALLEEALAATDVPDHKQDDLEFCRASANIGHSYIAAAIRALKLEPLEEVAMRRRKA